MDQLMTPISQPGRIYHFHHRNGAVKNPNDFMYHYHAFYEIYLFVSGKAEFIVEDTVYPLSENDIMVIPPYKFHKPSPEMGSHFERIVLNIFPGFFSELHCENYREILTAVTENGYKINNRLASKFGLLDKMYDITKTFNDNYSADNILPHLHIVELMYNLYSVSQSEDFRQPQAELKITDAVVLDVVQYINTHFRSISDVSSVTSVFNYSKNYLNKIFKENMGISIAKYINVKRFENVEKLHLAGYSLNEASVESGFNNYRHFAYAYKKEYGVSPRNGLEY